MTTDPNRTGGGGSLLTPLESAIRSWAMRPQRPTMILLFGRDGREHEVELRKGVTWAEAAKSMAALDPDRLEAYDGDDKNRKLIRATAVADLVQADNKAATVQAATAQAMMAASTDPETQRFIIFAELMERFASKCIAAIENTSGSAFQQMQEISSSLAAQAQAATTSANELSVGIRNLLIQQAQEAVEQASQQELTPLEQMAQKFVTGQTLAQAEAAATAAQAQTNGKAKSNGKH